jgi:hypothetical protein
MRTRTAVLLWAAVTIALWAALPLIPFSSHFTWFAWMPRHTPPGPPPAVGPHGVPHQPHAPLMLEMLFLLVMSSIVMAVVLWINSIRTRARA